MRFRGTASAETLAAHFITSLIGPVTQGNTESGMVPTKFREFPYA